MSTLPTASVITNAQAFWDLGPEEKMKSHPVRFELLIYYYDPIWQLVWGECEGVGSFLPVRGEPLPIKAGQRVLIEGVVQPARGILRSEVSIKVLAENALPSPLPTKGVLSVSSHLNAQWVELEGFVFQQREVDRNHVQYDVMSDGKLVTVRVLLDDAESVPQLFYTRARFNGVYVPDYDTSHQIEHLNLWVPRVEYVSVIGEVGADERFKMVRTPIERLEQIEKGAWARVVGEVHQFLPGQSLTIRDDSGQLTLSTPQSANLQPGDNVEVVGRVNSDGLTRTLIEGYFHPLPLKARDENSSGGLRRPYSKLRVVQQIMELPLSEVDREYPVAIKGVVAWSSPRVDFFYVQDGSGGICVWRDAIIRSPSVGDLVEIQGTTFRGRYAPEIKLREFAALGNDVPLRPRPVTLEQAMIGGEEARFVQIRGYLRQAIADGNWTRLDITTASGEFSAFAPADDSYAAFAGAMVQVAGVCSVTADSQRQMSGLRLWVPGKEEVVVEQAAQRDPFSVSPNTIVGLKQFSGVGAFNRRTVVSGVLISQVPGNYLVIQDGGSGLMVFARDAKPLTLGSVVQVTGLPGREGNRVVLREGMVRPSNDVIKATPLLLDPITEPRLEFDTQLVRVRAILNQSVPQNGAIRLTLQADGVIFDAILNQSGGWAPPEPGSQIELTGVYLVEYAANRQPRGFRLELRTPADVSLLATPTWWTAKHAFVVAAGLAVGMLLGTIWVTLLRRRVKAQTEQIRRQMEKEAQMQAELERATRLDSLGVLAGGIAHDFNNLLTAIMGNLGLIRLEPKAMELVAGPVNDAERASKRATEVTQQLLTFAKGGDPVRTVVELGEVVREAAGFARHGSSVQVEFEMAEGLPPAEVDASQISRVVHNLVLNAVQSLAGGGVVRLRLSSQVLMAGEISSLSAGRYLRLEVSDNGPGIPADRLPRIFDPYFTTKVRGSGLGLATCHSIVKKHLGHIEVKSSAATGTAFSIWLPAADRPVVNARFSTGPGLGAASLRVLFMDDDEVVRKLARSFLARAGHDGTLVTDGAEAVTVYRQAAEVGKAYDLVIFDLTVPGGMGGKDALAELLKIDPAVWAIASSGYSNDPVMANHAAFGFKAVLPKPYDLDKFITIINSVRRAPH